MKENKLIIRSGTAIDKGPRYFCTKCQALLVARVAQSVERSAVNRKVGGSNPPVSEFLLLCYIITIIYIQNHIFYFIFCSQFSLIFALFLIE